MLCNACQTLLELLQKQPIQTTEITHHACVTDVRSAIANGCLVCRRLDIWELDEDDAESKWSTVVVTERHEFDKLLPPNVIDLQFRSKKIDRSDDDNAFGPYTGCLRLIPVEATKDRLNVLDYFFPGNTVGDSDAISMARMWIRTCDEQHTLCKRPPVKEDSSWRPTRLVHVGKDDTQLRLVHGHSRPNDVEYATLSHCWGKLDNRLVLTEAELEPWCEKLPPPDH